jgi:hypothetical protein
MNTDLQLPEQIPEHLRRRARRLGDQRSQLVAWDRASAHALLSALRETKVAVVRGEVYLVSTEDSVPVEDWYCARLRGELATAYAARSRAQAASYVKRHQDQVIGATFFVLVFDAQDAAA